MKHAYAQRTWLKCNTLVRHNVPTARGAIYDQAAAVKGSDTASSWSGEGAGVADTPTWELLFMRYCSTTCTCVNGDVGATMMWVRRCETWRGVGSWH